MYKSKWIRSFFLLSFAFINADIEQVVQPTTSENTIAHASADRYLLEAITQNDLSKVKQAIRAGADVNGLTAQGSPLIWSVLNRGNIEIVLMLIKSGAKAIDYNGKSFAQAVLNKAISSLSQPGVMMNGMAPQLPFALECLSLLLSNGVDFTNVVSDVYEGKGQDIVKFALNLCETLIRSPNSRNKLEKSVSKANILELVQQLKNRGYAIIEKLWNKGDVRFYEDKDWVKLCLKNGININQNISVPIVNSSHVEPALFIAIGSDWVRAIETLLDAGANINQLADPDGKGMQTPLDWAFANQKTEAIDILLARGAKTSRQL
jgi:ankyrin repeat protein